MAVRLGELLHSRVVDADGRAVGRVHDVRLVQDGPVLDGFGHALRLEGVIVGAGGLGVRLGYHRHGVRGPALLKWLALALERRARYVAWSEVEAWDGEVVRLRHRASDLPRLTDTAAS
ncbi:MAG TPA: hypothetical protein VGB03_06620 [Acidimicrobiales bacterium]